MDIISVKNVTATFEVAPPEKDLAANDALSEIFSLDDVAKHNRPDDLWVVVGDEVYDMTKYQEEHPGGKKILQKVAGKDATKQFRKYHRDAILIRFRDDLKVGVLGTEEDKLIKKRSTASRFALSFIRWGR